MRKNVLTEDAGSASVEFVLLAIPLFLPIFIFFSHFANATDAHTTLRTLARESARAFVMSENDETAYRVASDVIEKGAQVLGYRGEVTLEIQCGERPCISPDSKVTTSVTVTLKNSEKLTVSAIEYVSPWA